MPDDSKALQITIQFDPSTGGFGLSFPDNHILALGMLDYARECLVHQRILPAFSKRVVEAVGVPLGSVGRS